VIIIVLSFLFEPILKPPPRNLAIEIVGEPSCKNGTVNIVIRNIGTIDIQTSFIKTINASISRCGPLITTATKIPRGKTVVYVATDCESGKTHVWRMGGPNVTYIEASVYCP